MATLKPYDASTRRKSIPQITTSAINPSDNIRTSTRKPSSQKPGMLSFLSLKEPSTSALEDYARQQKKLAAQKGSSSIPSRKLPAHVPRVNSKWDGLPERGPSSRPTPANHQTPAPSSRESWTSSSRSSGEKPPNRARGSTAVLGDTRRSSFAPAEHFRRLSVQTGSGSEKSRRGSAADSLPVDVSSTTSARAQAHHSRESSHGSSDRRADHPAPLRSNPAFATDRQPAPLRSNPPLTTGHFPALTRAMTFSEYPR